jgi:hypothetical protein
MPKAKSKEGAGANGRWVEIVNWRKAQPKMRGRGNTWMKLYTSLLDHEGFEGLDDTSRVLIIALWLYAARSGRHVFPADPKWIAKKIPMLHKKPNFKPLLEASDAFGNAEPFLRYCEAPPAEEAEPQAKPKRGTQRTRKAKPEEPEKREEKRREERRTEKTRAEQKRPPNPDGFGKERKEKKRRVPSTPRKRTAQQSRSDQGQKPENPKQSEAEAASATLLPHGTPPPSVGRIRGVCRIGDVVKLHWLDPDAEAFGWQIVEALGLDGDRLDREVRSQWGAFAAWWVTAKAHVPGPLLGELREKAVGKAKYIRKKGRSAKRPGAVWQTIMRAELARFSSRAPPAAAMG